jgi:hypothetical protein
MQKHRSCNVCWLKHGNPEASSASIKLGGGCDYNEPRRAVQANEAALCLEILGDLPEAFSV